MGFDELAFEEVGLGFTRVCGLLDGVAQRIVVIQIRHNEYYLILYFATPPPTLLFSLIHAQLHSYVPTQTQSLSFLSAFVG